jgi:hypothetical protein
VSEVPERLKKMSIPKLRNEIKKLETMRRKAFNRWHEWMNGAWGQDPNEPLLMKEAAREAYRRYRNLDSQVDVVEGELMDRYRPVDKDLPPKRA